MAARRRALQPAVIGVLPQHVAAESRHLLTAIPGGLKEAGFVDGQNVAIESIMRTIKMTGCQVWWLN